MRYLTAMLLVITSLALYVYAANDPNTLVKPPIPKVEYVSKVDDNTIRITTSIDITKKDLLRQKVNLEKEIAAREAELAIVNKRLDAFK